MPDLAGNLRTIRRDLRAEYLQSHDWPWMSGFIREQVSHAGHAVLLLGVRRDESSRRAQSVAKFHDNLESRLSEHNDHPGCYIFAPIRDITTEEVWARLLAARPPWGGSYRDLVALYKEAGGNECPFVLSKADAPGCGTNSARFGCWTCTVVDKDRSLDSLIAGDHQHLEPLADFRRRLKTVSEDPGCRSKTRRNRLRLRARRAQNPSKVMLPGHDNADKC